MKTVISTSKAPAAIGPYSQAIRKGDTLYLSGQIGMVPATGELVSDDVKEQTAPVSYTHLTLPTTPYV